MLTIVMLNVVMLSIVMLNVVMLSVVAPWLTLALANIEGSPKNVRLGCKKVWHY